MADTYTKFLLSKTRTITDAGFEVRPRDLNSALFPFQRDLVAWSLRKGRSALFADTGLGKTPMQLEWVNKVTRKVKGRGLILAPLAVAQQTVGEGEKFGIDVSYCRSQDDVGKSRIAITNYEMLDKFDASKFEAIVLDESSILKNFDGKTRTKLIETFARTPYRLCCTATPAPNDIAEIANHAEFLGVMKRVEMLASFFVHDDEGWRLKGHASEAFYQWLASWAMTIKKPSDLGYEDGGFKLPGLEVIPHWVDCDYRPEGMLFFTGLDGIKGRSEVRRNTLKTRVEKAAELVQAEPKEPWLIWCGLNDEGQAMKEKLVESTVLVEGADSLTEKIDSLVGFTKKRYLRMITKAKIAGMGMNFQHCSRMLFLGMNDSQETYYQAIRRCWRFGQKKPVQVHIVLSEPERVIYDNVMAKEARAAEMSRELLKHVVGYEREEIVKKAGKTFTFQNKTEVGENWRLILGDSAEEISKLEPKSIDMSVFSPPFVALYVYSGTERDLGNSKGDKEYWDHYRYISEGVLKATKPGRLCCTHISNIATLKSQDGYIGLRDIRGDLIRHMQSVGWIYHGEICIQKNPQVQAIRTHAKGLLFVQMHKDSTWSRPGLADYICLFRKPGENAVPVVPDLTNNEWVEWACPVWFGIRETDVLNTAVAKDNKDERHICPLQLGTIERCIRLWSNAGETVLTPFAGIGSEVYQALMLGRKGIGVELKPEYFKCAVRNVKEAERKSKAGTLFALAEEVAHAEG